MLGDERLDPGRATIIRWDSGTTSHAEDEISIEEPLEIRVRGRAISVTMRSPGHDDELAAGFLLTEGIIRHAGDVLRIEHCDQNEHGNVLNVLLSPDVSVDFQRLTRHVFASSSCGLCGKATIDSVQSHFPPIESDLMLDAKVAAGLPAIMRAAQKTFDRTGGLHAAALFDVQGNLIVLREDIGRHNAVDKVIGHRLLGCSPGRGTRHMEQENSQSNPHVLLVSGRSSFEIVQKALAGRIAIVASVSAPSSLAVSFAQCNGQTLIGFLRGQHMNIYSHPQRIRAGVPIGMA
jgi:FdhD protein